MDLLSYQLDFKKSIENPENFWLEKAQQINWFKSPEKALSVDTEGLYRWFKGGKINICYNALDLHVLNGFGNQTAVIYDSPVTQTIEKYTYQELLNRVSKCAGGLRKLGVNKGDTVIIYMPMIPQALITMLACARIGAVHSVVFGGFAPHELAIRIDDAKPKVILTSTSGIEVDKIIPYKPMVDEAMKLSTHKPDHVIVHNRKLGAIKPDEDYDIDYSTLMKLSDPVDCVEMDATDPLYILYTSGTTGVPKGIIRDHGGYAVALNYSMKYNYGLEQGDVFWAASDVGWVVGHSYIVYAPLLYRATTVIYEGKPVRTPDASSFWRVISEHKVNVMFTAPTAIRAIKKEDPEGRLFFKYDLTSLKYQFLAGERCDVSTLNWLQKHLQIPVIDHWWQTESGWPMVSNMVGYGDPIHIKPGSVSNPVCGYNLKILREDGSEANPNEGGYVSIKLPLPPGTTPNLWGNTQRFKSGYLSMFEGYYASGDGGYVDKDGYVFITGRVDDIINVAGHRLSTAEMEEIVSAHPDVSECCVIGISNDLKGQIPLAIVVLNQSSSAEHFEIKADIIQRVRHDIGPVASLKNVMIVDRLPKTRSGKILRKTIRSIADNTPYNIPSTIDNPQILHELEEKFKGESIR